MRPRIYLSILAALLLVLPAIGIANAQEPAAPVITDQASATITTLTTNEVVQAASEAQVSDDVVAAVAEMETLTFVCGDCSVPYCRGANRGTPCGDGRWCIPANTMLCPGTSEWDCQCARYYN